MKRRGFTLIEVLCVLAIVGTLCGLLFPTFGGARRAAAAARTRTQFAQWTAGIESFRGEYGCYPVFASDGLVNGNATAVEHPFHDVLAGRHRDGSALTPGSASALQNRRAIAFCVFGDAAFNDAKLLQDASCHSAMAVLVDRDLDGVIKAGSDFVTLPAVDGQVPTADDFPADGIRAGVVLYAPAPGSTPENPAFVFSWK
jgi:prepilin-type N-terminal cleavage/methylation domain-containing protein